MKPVSTDESRRFHRVLPIPVVALFGNSVDPLGEALMRLFPDGFATSLPVVPPGAAEEPRVAALGAAARLDMEGPACRGAAVAPCGQTLESASATIDRAIAIFMILCPGLADFTQTNPDATAPFPHGFSQERSGNVRVLEETLIAEAW